MHGSREKAFTCVEVIHCKPVKPRPLWYNGAILKKLVVFLRKVELFLLQLGRSKEEEHLRGVGSFTKAGWKLWCSRKGLWLAHRSLAGKGHPLRLRTYYKLNGEGWSFFAFSRDATRKTNVLAAWEASLKQGGSVVVREGAVASLPSSNTQRSSASASQRSPPSAAQRYST